MRVEGSPALLQALLAAKVGRAEAPASPMRQAAAKPASPPLRTFSAPAPSVAVLVTLAALSPDEQRRHQAIADARNGVEVLGELHRDLLRGVLPAARLRTLRDWARRRLRPDDPELAALMDEIELRILVELAKLEP